MERNLPKEEAMARLLEGQSALITGGGGGIGRATSLAFAREGARVAVADAAEQTAKETVALINAAGGHAMSLTGDVTNAGAVEAMVKAVVAAYGRLDCAFNNAGIAGFQVDASGKKTADWSEASFDRMIAVNLKGVWLCMKHELPQMIAQGGGAIVNTASIAGLISGSGNAYNVTKYGVVALSEGLRVELAPRGIGVSVLCPGFIRTQIVDSVRNLPERFAGARPAQTAPSQATIETWLGNVRERVAGGIDPLYVGELVREGIEGDWPYIFTDSEFEPAIEARFGAIKAGFDRIRGRVPPR
jgi:NAD(P)-dependent dehydrogenase (short-subunit alcohol dehydrogenase family)